MGCHPVDDGKAIIEHIREAITDYRRQLGVPERLIIHYYKPQRRDEIKNILKTLEDMS